MDKNLMQILLLIVGVIIGFLIGWLIFSGITTQGQANKIINTSVYQQSPNGANPTTCSPVPHTCSGTIGTCTTSRCVTIYGKLWWDCSGCTFANTN